MFPFDISISIAVFERNYIIIILNQPSVCFALQQNALPLLNALICANNRKQNPVIKIID